MANNNTPLEHYEQVEFVNWLVRQGLKHTSVPNNTYTKSWSQKRKNKAEGLNPGYSDLIVLVAPSQSKDSMGYHLCIEMKRVKGGVQSKDQKAWEVAVNGLNTPHVQYYIAKGAAEAIKIVSHYLKTVDNSIF